MNNNYRWVAPNSIRRQNSSNLHVKKRTSILPYLAIFETIRLACKPAYDAQLFLKQETCPQSHYRSKIGKLQFLNIYCSIQINKLT